MKRFLTVDYGVSDQVTVERCQLAAVSNGQGQQITVSHLARVEQAATVHALAIQKGNVIRPELMPAERAQDREQLSRRCRSPWRIRIARMAHYAENAVLRQRTSSPGLPATLGEPVVRPVMLHMRRIDQCDQNIHIQQITRHGNSSCSCRTSSEVTLGVPGRTASRGTPFRVARAEGAGRIAFRARSEITSPTLLRSVAAISRAAAKTSSSMAKVVRKQPSNFEHHTSIIIHQFAVEQNTAGLIRCNE